MEASNLLTQCQRRDPFILLRECVCSKLEPPSFFRFHPQVGGNFRPPVSINEGFRPFETQRFLRNMCFCVRHGILLSPAFPHQGLRPETGKRVEPSGRARELFVTVEMPVGLLCRLVAHIPCEIHVVIGVSKRHFKTDLVEIPPSPDLLIARLVQSSKHELDAAQ